MFPILGSFITGLTWTASHAAPQVQGTSITFTASATGGTGPYQFKWWVYNGTTWTIGQNWSTATSFTWTPATANANYRVSLWARSAGNAADMCERELGRSFAILGSVLTSATFTASHAAPQGPGTSITFTAAATGGTAPYRVQMVGLRRHDVDDRAELEHGDELHVDAGDGERQLPGLPLGAQRRQHGRHVREGGHHVVPHPGQFRSPA